MSAIPLVPNTVHKYIPKLIQILRQLESKIINIYYVILNSWYLVQQRTFTTKRSHNLPAYMYMTRIMKIKYIKKKNLYKVWKNKSRIYSEKSYPIIMLMFPGILKIANNAFFLSWFWFANTVAVYNVILLVRTVWGNIGGVCTHGNELRCSRRVKSSCLN